MRIATFFLLSVFVLTGCGGKKTAMLINTSANGKVNINVSATKASAVDPWKVIIAVKAYSFKEGKLEFEIYADDITNETVKFEWKDNQNCRITFKQSDGTTRTFQLIADAGEVQLGEVSQQ